MIEWLDAMLEHELSLGIAEANSHENAEANSHENIELFWREIEPVEAIIQRLRQGDADADDQERAAYLLETLISPAPKKRGPRPKAKIERDENLTLAARDAVRIKALWREHYGRIDSKKAVEFACKRWVHRYEHNHKKGSYDRALADLIEKVSETLGRPKARNFGA